MDYEKEYEKMVERNLKFIKNFEDWLLKKDLKEKTIKNHISNVELYINDFLNYYEITKMEDGCGMLDSFLGDWFIRKCMWSTASSVKSTAASIKKFYGCMTEQGFVSKEDYNFLCQMIKDEMDNWCDEVEEYNSFDDYMF